VALIERSRAGLLRVGGNDRRDYLHNLLTNDIASLRPGTGCYAALLTPQGRMVSDMRVFELGDRILIDLPRDLAEEIRAHLERFVFSEDVQVEDVSAALTEVGVYGPSAAGVLEKIVVPSGDLAALPLFGSTARAIEGTNVLIISSDEPGVSGFDLVVDVDRAERIRDVLRSAGAKDVDPADVESVRIEAGRPLFGIDMDNETIPLEAGIEDRAISRTKGCYVGQEVIVRVLDRGHGRVARRLVGLVLAEDAPVPEAGATITSGAREIGRVTSATMSPALHTPIALAYVHRDFTAQGTAVTAGGLTARVSDLPFALNYRESGVQED
jgi:tRNA-modifying protein YgfZ